jgi:type III secretion protein J
MKRSKIAAFFVLIFPLMFFYACGGTELQHGLTEDQANEVLVVLQQNGVDASKVLEPGEHPTWAISVPSQMAAKSWKVMKDHDLPRAPQQGFSETFGKGSLIPTATEEKALYMNALCNELGETIRRIDGVITARVHLVLPEEQLVQEATPAENRPKAAVLIKYRLNSNGEVPYRDDAIRNLVANSIQKLDPKDVVIIGTEVNEPATAGANSVTSYTQFGPIKLANESVMPFKIAAVVALAIIALLAVGLILSARKSSNLRSEINRINDERSARLAKVG